MIMGLLNDCDYKLSWIDQHVDGKPYGIDILIPENLSDLVKMKDVTMEQLHASTKQVSAPSPCPEYVVTHVTLSLHHDIV